MVAFALAGVAIGSAVFTPTVAAAHPFGDPQTVDVALDAQRPEVVRVHWRVGGPDDLTLLGVSLGVLPQDRVRADGTVDYQYTDPDTVGASEQFAGYLLQRITVTAEGRSCAGAVERPIRALGLKGATADYTCPGPVATATVAVRMLTDLNPAYKTLATGPAGQRTVYQGDNDSHDWTLTGPPATDGAGLGRSAAVQLAAVIGGLLLAAAGGLAVAYRLRRARRQVAA
ncbi:hypothetical protein [Dactylosporangium sp. CA-092794]|uniref:hypothetical protein n=1 Tax=Dactylosporangium sp. CA-092794 TaxID=3239929 RepID=UPI003D8A3568